MSVTTTIKTRRDMSTTTSTTEYKDCPYCAETILLQAKKCKHCGEILDPQMREIESLKQQIHNNSNPVVVNNNNNNNNGAGVQYILVRRPYKHFWHIVMTLLTGGGWLPIWILCYILRNKRIYE
jgi:hypothetical protein